MEQKEPGPVKLIIGMITNNINLFERAGKILEKKFGKMDFESYILEFKYTDYYNEEMGMNLKRKFVSFKKLILPPELIKIKLFTNKLERKFIQNSRRKINLDPGYLNEGKVVLASTKDNLQRIYLGKGIYAEITLYYKNKNYEHFLWTYPDYRTQEYKDIFQEIREIFRKQLGKKSNVA